MAKTSVVAEIQILTERLNETRQAINSLRGEFIDFRKIFVGNGEIGWFEHVNDLDQTFKSTERMLKWIARGVGALLLVAVTALASSLIDFSIDRVLQTEVAPPATSTPTAFPTPEPTAIPTPYPYTTPAGGLDKRVYAQPWPGAGPMPLEGFMPISRRYDMNTDIVLAFFVTLLTLVPAVGFGAPTIALLVDTAKRVGMPSKFSPLMSLVLNLALYAIVYFTGPEKRGQVEGVVAAIYAVAPFILALFVSLIMTVRSHKGWVTTGIGYRATPR